MNVEEMAPGRTPEDWRRRRVNALIAVVLVVQVVGTTFAGRHVESIDALGYAFLVAGPLALFLRHRYPASVLVFNFATALTYVLLDYPRGPIFFGLIIAFFTAVFEGRRAVAWGILPVGWASFLWLPRVVGIEPAPSVGAILGLAAWLGLLGTVAEIVRVRRERAIEAAQMRVEERRRRASEERLRIAQELHDVLGHHISLISVQSGVALHLMDEKPEQARTALSAINDASKEALSELRSVLSILRRNDDEVPRSPTPSVRRIDELVNRAGAAGLTVTTQVVGDARPLPLGVDLAAYRIVQEALTNIARHAAAKTATVHVTYGDDEVTVQVDDDGRGVAARKPTSGGSGIPGMRERASSVGGSLEAGPRPEGGFRVSARLPMNGTR